MQFTHPMFAYENNFTHLNTLQILIIILNLNEIQVIILKKLIKKNLLVQARVTQVTPRISGLLCHL
jgi:hypothetical protein